MQPILYIEVLKKKSEKACIQKVRDTFQGITKDMKMLYKQKKNQFRLLKVEYFINELNGNFPTGSTSDKLTTKFIL